MWIIVLIIVDKVSYLGTAKPNWLTVVNAELMRFDMPLRKPGEPMDEPNTAAAAAAELGALVYAFWYDEAAAAAAAAAAADDNDDDEDTDDNTLLPDDEDELVEPPLVW